MPIKKKLILVLTVVVAGVVLVIAYFYFRAPKTLADVVGSRFMEPDQLVVLNGNNGNRTEVTGKDREEILELVRGAEIEEIEYIDLMHGGNYLDFCKGNDQFTLSIYENYSFRVNDPGKSRMIVYHVDKEKGKRINELVERYY